MTSARIAERADTVGVAARSFCKTLPHQDEPYRRRNWGGTLHSLCSYQGKLKPSIAHFLVSWFTEPGDRVLDPMAGVGTIPLEARRLGRVGIANDLSPLADAVARPKVEPCASDAIAPVVDRLLDYIAAGPSLRRLTQSTDVDFGLNGPIHSYFHPDTLREVLLARQFFLTEAEPDAVARDVVRSSLLHILHGNRPYALSRRSHPVTPFAPTGDTEYRPLETRLRARLAVVVPLLADLTAQGLPGEAHLGDFRTLELNEQVDAIITSPPFARSLRFWSTNWMRLWFAGWEPQDFNSEPPQYLEVEQRNSFQPYADFTEACARLLRRGGMLIMHLGETAQTNMANEIAPYLEPAFDVVFAGREDVLATESHGLSDKGATTAHWYLFAQAR